MAGQYLYIDRLDAVHDEEAVFNSMYDREMLPGVRKVPGLLRATRYRNESPTEPRYFTIYEIASPKVIASAEWESAMSAWVNRLFPLTMNRHDAVYSRVGGKDGLKYSTRYLFCVNLDVEAHKEALMNELYDVEHIPLLLKVPGVLNAVRYKANAQGYPKYLAIYEIGRPEIPTSKEWVTAADSGRWKPEVRPYTYNKRFVVYEAIGGERPV